MNFTSSLDKEPDSGAAASSLCAPGAGAATGAADGGTSGAAALLSNYARGRAATRAADGGTSPWPPTMVIAMAWAPLTFI